MDLEPWVVKANSSRLKFQMKSISVNRDQSNAFQAQKGRCTVCACVREHSRALLSSAWASFFWPTISVDRKWDTKTREMVWNNKVLYFQQFTKLCREKAIPQPHRGGASMRRTHWEQKDLSPSKTAVFSHQFLRGWTQAGSLRIAVVPCEFRGLEGLKHRG